MDKEHMKTVLFGYDRKTVDMFLKKLHRMQEEELEELRRKISKASGERKRLLAQLHRLEEKRKESLPEELMESARLRVEETLQLLKRQEDMEAMSTAAQPEDSTGESSSSKAIDFYDAAAKRAKKVTLLKEWQQRPSAFFGEAAGMPDDPSPIGESKPKEKERQQVKHTDGLGFWEDIATYMEPIGTDFMLLPHIQNETVAATLSHSYEEAEGSISADAVTSSNKEPSQGQPVPPIGAAESAATAESPAEPAYAASPELDALKRSYIVGKVAGEDLLDRRGHVIVARNSVITEDAVRMAEREGKLAELIVNMIIPGLED